MGTAAISSCTNYYVTMLLAFHVYSVITARREKLTVLQTYPKAKTKQFWLGIALVPTLRSL
jgi:hypothetical protein